MAYSGSIDLIAGIRPKNNGTFPLINAHDVYVDDNTRLDEALQAAGQVEVGDVTTTKNGLMLATDKVKLNKYPDTTSTDAGKFLKVNSSGNIVAVEMTYAEGVGF